MPVWRVVTTTISESSPLEYVDLSDRLKHGLTALPPLQRRVLLLVVVEKLTHAEVARILDLDEAEVGELLARARQDLHQQVSVHVLIIEDETLIAMELGRIMQSMGHNVVGVANREAMAVKQAEQTSPGLVLCDIKLLDEDTGIAAAQRILSVRMPVVFVTAFSEMLLTGGRLEPAFVVSKPFAAETLKVTVAQALSTYASPETASDHKTNLLAKLAEISRGL